MKIGTLVWAGIAAAVLAAPARAADKPEDLAQSAAESWLKLSDAGDAGASWDQAGCSRVQSGVWFDSDSRRLGPRGRGTPSKELEGREVGRRGTGIGQESRSCWGWVLN